MTPRFTSCWLTAALLLALTSAPVLAADPTIPPRVGDYRTVASGNFTSASIWEVFVPGASGTAVDGVYTPAITAPTNADGTIRIRANHTVLINSSLNLDEVEIDSAGVLEHDGLFNITFTDSPAAWELVIRGTFRELSATNRVNLLPGATILVDRSGTWRHSANGGSLPVATWDSRSLLLFDGIVTATGLTGRLGQEFGRVTWNCPLQTSTFAFGPASTESNAVTSVAAGDFTVISTGALGKLQLASTTKPNPILLNAGYEQLGGDVYVNFSVGAPRTVNVATDLNLRGGRFTVTASNSPSATGLVYVSGGLHLWGGTLNISSSSRPGSVGATGAITFDAGATLQTTGSGTATFNFGPGPVRPFRNQGTIAGPILFNVNGGTTIDFGNQILTGSGTFTLVDGAIATFGSPDGITAVGAPDQNLGNIRVGSVTPFQRTYSPLAYYIYSCPTAQFTGSGLPAEVGTASADLNAGGFGVRHASATTTTTLSQALRISGELILGNGLIVSTPVNKLTLSSSAFMDAISSGSPTSYVQGILARDLDSTLTMYSYPIGDRGAYRPLLLRWPYPTGKATYDFTANLAPAPNSGSLSNDNGRALTNLVGDTYWDVARTAASAASLPGAIARLTYNPAQVMDLNRLTVAGYNTITNQWEDMGVVARDPVNNWLEAQLAPQYSRVAFGMSAIPVLPVELTRFTASWQGSVVALKWSTASEKNSAWFAVERSADGREFKEILRQTAAGNTVQAREYAATDDRPLKNQTAYYRLRQLDVDGSAHLSEIVAVKGSPVAEQPLALYPNPAADRVTVQLPESAATAGAVVRVTNALGQEMLRQVVTAGTELALDLQDLPDGTYSVLLSAGGQPTTMQRLVKSTR